MTDQPTAIQLTETGRLLLKCPDCAKEYTEQNIAMPVRLAETSSQLAALRVQNETLSQRLDEFSECRRLDVMKIKKLKEALEFYGNNRNYEDEVPNAWIKETGQVYSYDSSIEADYGQRARTALAEGEDKL
jgi:hypothetical protein